MNHEHLGYVDHEEETEEHVVFDPGLARHSHENGNCAMGSKNPFEYLWPTTGYVEPPRTLQDNLISQYRNAVPEELEFEEGDPNMSALLSRFRSQGKKV